jgi:hypothetical protein
MGKGIELGPSSMSFLVCESICILFYGLFTDYGEKTSPLTTADEDKEINKYLHAKYPLF